MSISIFMKRGQTGKKCIFPKLFRNFLTSDFKILVKEHIMMLGIGIFLKFI